MNFYNEDLLKFNIHNDKKYLFDVFTNKVLINHSQCIISIDEHIISLTYFGASDYIKNFKKKCFENL